MKTLIERKTFTAGGADQACEDYINKTRQLYKGCRGGRHSERSIVNVQEVGKNYPNAEALMAGNPVSIEYLIVWEAH